MENTTILEKKHEGKQQEHDTATETEVKTTLKLPKRVLDGYRHLAIDDSRTMTELVIEALEQYLKSRKSKK